MGLQEQEEEIEALSFIFPQEFTKISSNQLDIIVNVQDNSGQESSILLKVEFPLEYPDVPLDFSLSSLEIDQKELEILTDRITDKIQEFIGLAMVFSIVEFIKTEILDILDHKFTMEISKDLSNFEEKKVNGTRVTREVFQEWKENLKLEILKLMSDRKELSKSLSDFAQIEKIVKNVNKITGRQMFERDQSLIDTDLMTAQDEDVVVDLDLFKGMSVDDLEDEGIDFSI
jgi:6-pyruvoyl-tetrahydropterin synthase